MVVVVALVVGLILLVPRPSAVNPSEVDLVRAAERAAPSLPFTPLTPVAPPRWSVTSGEAERDTDGVPTWRVGYRAPSGEAAGFVQAAVPTQEWEDAQVTDGREGPPVTITGRQWVPRHRLDRGIFSLVLREPGRTLIVTGRAQPSELEQLARALTR
jgi:hypothetical protein